ncbi:MAG TPA: hypothetical protein VNF47_22625 [Streptosporangiaceae bacterium]|nr:hypothetical protein [Streptosporangiaceae bacterium]
MRHRTWVKTAGGVSLIAAVLAGIATAADASGASQGTASRLSAVGHSRTTGLAAGNPFCESLGKRYQASAAAQLFCFGSQHKIAPATPPPSARPAMSGTLANVDAASPAEDVTPALVRLYGQSETSIAAAGRYVVEAWNDATAFASRCGARHFKEEATGLGFSANGGRSFTDLGGLPNPGCRFNVYEGDPSVVAYRVGRRTFFYISSLLDSPSGSGVSFIGLDACQATGTGAAAALRCGRPVIAASSRQCIEFGNVPQFCSFLDKDFMAIDPARGRLYVAFSEFPVIGSSDTAEMSACDIGTAAGRAGRAGGTPAHPVCRLGSPLFKQAQPQIGPGAALFAGKPYFTVAGIGFRGCEVEGTYPAVNVATGAVYVAYEFNWFSSIASTNCQGFRAKIRDIVTRTPLGCLRLTAVAACARPANLAGVAVFSLEAASIIGYNRSPVSDFPRIAVSDRFGDVSMVWNDTRHHGYGDIMLQSFKLGSLRRVQRFPTTLDVPHHGGLSMLPALRVAGADGRLDVAWYSRSSVLTADTSVVAAIGVSPAATATPANVRITNQVSNWLYDNSDLSPNFGDYIDAVVSATGSWPFVGNTLYVAWSDGRLGWPQPFEAHRAAG